MEKNVSVLDYLQTKEILELLKKYPFYKKGVKRLSRPYLETKVVKVKKEKDFWCGGIRIGNKQYKVFKRKKGVPYLKEFDKPKKGNWINGENLDKIKFPCFCRFTYCGTKYLGQINYCSAAELPYRLVNIGEQDDSNTYRQSDSLKELVKSCDIHIRKGKIIIFEEENNE